MKNVMFFAILLVSGTIAHAKTICTVNTGHSKAEMTYDQILFSKETAPYRYVIVKRDRSSAQEVDINHLDSYAKWKSIDGDTLITLTQRENGEHGVAVGTIRVSKAETNMTPMEVFVNGVVTDKQILSVILPKANLSIVCFNQ